MKLLRRIVPLVLLLVLVGWLPAQSLAASPGMEHELVVLHTNDHHGHPLKFDEYPVSDVGGLAARATAVAAVRAKHENVLVVDAGDFNTGMPESNFFYAEPDILGYNYIGYDAAAVGNHEFDVDMTTMQRQITMSEFPWLLANAHYKNGNPIPNVEPYTVIEFDGFKVGVIGLLTAETSKTGNPRYVGDIVFEDEVETANRLVPKILGEADIVVAVVHMGIYDDLSVGAPALAAQVPGLALVVSGHSHTGPDDYVIVTNEETGAQVPVVQAHQWGRYVGQVTLRFQNGVVTDFSIDPISINHKERITLDSGDRVIRPVGPQFAEDPQLLAKLVPFREQVAEVMEEVIGTASGVFDQAIVRKQESAIGNAVADSMYWYADKFQLKPDFAFQNGGGIRADLPEGTITIGDVYQTIPFDNTVVTVTMSGGDVTKLFESTPEKVTHGAMPQVSKQVSFTIDTGTGAIANLMIGGKPVDPKRRYVVVTNSYLAEGGDGYDAFKNSFALYDTSAMQRDALMDYIREGLNGRLLLQTDGRMTVK